MNRLEQDGTIVGYTLRLKPSAEALSALRGHPNVFALHTTNGRWDIVAELRADTLENFDRMPDAIRCISGIATTETSILLSTHKV